MSTTDWLSSLTKTCESCGKPKPLASFFRSRRRTATYSLCEDCVNNSHRRYNLKRLYGLSVAEFNAILEGQEGKCVICGLSFEDNKELIPCMDHDHKSKKNREIICKGCNAIVGIIESEKGMRAIQYVLRHKKESDNDNSPQP